MIAISARYGLSMSGGRADLPPPGGEGRGGGPRHVRRARTLRNNATPAERKLWGALRELRRSYGLHVRRQVPIGLFIADFAIHGLRLVIEIDGWTHDDQAYDARRDAWFAQAGYRVLRFGNADVMADVDGVFRAIVHDFGLGAAAPHPDPPLKGEGEGR